MKKTAIEHFSNLPVVLLTSFNRGALFFVHGLVDSHHQVSTTPFIFPLLNLVSQNVTSNDIHDLRWISVLQGFMQEKLDNEKSRVCLADFSKYYLEFLAESEFDNRVKSIFYAAHYAWSMLCNQEIDNLKVIFWHPHHHDEDYEYFAVNVLECKIIFTSKDPREALVSAYKFWESSDGMHLQPPTVTSYLFDDLIFFYLSRSLDSHQFYLKNRSLSFVIKTKEMNEDPEKIIREMTNFMDIEVTDHVFSPTFLGQDKSGFSSRGLEGFDKKINDERWQSELSNFVITFLELIYYGHLREFGYSPKIVVGRDELVARRGNVIQALIKLPRSMRTLMLENAKHDAVLTTGKHLHPKLKNLEIFLRLMRKYLLLTIRCINIYKHFRRDYKAQLLAIKSG